MQNTISHTYKQWYKFAIRLFLTLIAAFILLGGVLFYVQYRSGFELIKALQEETLDDLSNAIMDEINEVHSDILFLTRQNDLTDFLELPYSYYRDQIGTEYYHFAKLKEKYNQLRLLNEEGYELVRVNYQDGYAEIVSDDLLQFKGDRYYFEESTQLDRDRIYISPFDLNVEEGEIEIPYNPMIRFGTPVFNNLEELKGAIILNYSGDRLLAILNEYEELNPFKFYMVNDEGYWLKGPDPARDWGFMFEDGSAWTIQNEVPGFWDKILIDENGVFDNEDGFYSYTNMFPFDKQIFLGSSSEDNPPDPYEDMDQYHWHLISFLPKHRNSQIIMSLLPGYLTIGGLLLISAGIISVLISYNNYLREETNRALEHSATHDSLTGLPNRELFSDRLIHAVELAKRQNSMLAVLFIDLDGFKGVNDTFGHHTGDKLLIEVSNRLKSCIRASDTVARFSGDEFVCLMENLTSKEDAEKIAEKLNQAIANKFVITEFIIQISGSIGISIWPEDTESHNLLLRYADEAMYVVKGKTKNSYAFYSDLLDQ